MFKELDSIVIILTAIALSFILALWISLIIWTIRDIRQRTKDRLFRFLSVLSVAVFNFPGLVIYMILRPRHTFTEYYQTALEEEALLQSIEGFGTCSECGHQIKSDWKFCPYCTNILFSECKSCGTLLNPDWIACPQCGTSTVDQQGTVSIGQNQEFEIQDQFEEDASLVEKVETESEEAEIILEEEEFDSFQED